MLSQENDKPIHYTIVIEWRWPRLVRRYTRYPRLSEVARPQAEYDAANPERIAEWRRGEQSDNLETRKQ